VKTLGKPKVFKRTTWRNSNGEYLDKIDYMMVKRSFQTSANFAKETKIPGADIGSYREEDKNVGPNKD